MKILKRVVIVLVIVVAALAGIGLLLPGQVHVERSAVIGALPATVFTLVNGYRRFNEWSPWHGRDPQAKYAYDGPPSGVGAKFSWSGDPKTIGAGSWEIIESRPWEAVKTHLDFGDQGVATAQFTLAPEGEGTRVTWGVDIDLGMSPVSRYFGLMLEGMIGPDYEQGLSGLKKLAESLPKGDFAALGIETVEVSPATVAYVAASCPKEEKAIAAAIGGAYAQVGRFMAAQRLKQAAPPITINTKWDDSGYEFEAGIPVDRAPDKEIPAGSAVMIKQTYSGKALKVVHRGPYRNMKSTYDGLFAYLAAHGYESAGPPWDEYVSDPGNTPEPELITHVFLPIR